MCQAAAHGVHLAPISESRGGQANPRENFAKTVNSGPGVGNNDGEGCQTVGARVRSRVYATFMGHVYLRG